MKLPNVASAAALVLVLLAVAQPSAATFIEANCVSGQTNCNGWCQDLMTSVEHCGRCNNRCNNGISCHDGICDDSPICFNNLMTRCGLDCVDTKTHTNNCGACGQRCDKPGQACVDGQCTCPQGLTLCNWPTNGWCQDLMTNREHCGACGNLCPPGIGCINGICQLPCIPGRKLTTEGQPCTPPPPPPPTPCPANAWSLTYTQGWWRQSYCAKVLGQRTGSCNSATPGSACALTLPAFSSLPANLQSIVTATCGALTGVGSTEKLICQCFSSVSGGAKWNALGHVMNTLLGTLTTINNPSGSVCPGATYVAAGDAYVCTKPGASSPCTCPTGKVSAWGSTVSTACRTFLNEGADEGKCLPRTSGNCQLQSCPCS